MRPAKRFTTRWATAAVVLLAVFFVSERVSDVEFGGLLESDATRNVGTVATSLQLLSPGPGVIVDADELIFIWDAVDDSLYYDIRIVTDSGGLVIEQRVQQTEWPLSNNIELSPDTDYFVRIDAVLPDARTVSSDHVRFRVAGKK